MLFSKASTIILFFRIAQQRIPAGRVPPQSRLLQSSTASRPVQENRQQRVAPALEQPRQQSKLKPNEDATKQDVLKTLSKVFEYVWILYLNQFVLYSTVLYYLLFTYADVFKYGTSGSCDIVRPCGIKYHVTV